MVAAAYKENNTSLADSFDKVFFLSFSGVCVYVCARIPGFFKTRALFLCMATVAQ